MRWVEERHNTIMGFGKNPHVDKAKAAEQKAADATDERSRSNAWREAAHQWERAADREKFDKRIAEYTQHAENARAAADNVATPDTASPTPPASSTLLN
jgi:hypothetical protein